MIIMNFNRSCQLFWKNSWLLLPFKWEIGNSTGVVIWWTALKCLNVAVACIFSTFVIPQHERDRQPAEHTFLQLKFIRFSFYSQYYLFSDTNQLNQRKIKPLYAFDSNSGSKIDFSFPHSHFISFPQQRQQQQPSFSFWLVQREREGEFEYFWVLSCTIYNRKSITVSGKSGSIWNNTQKLTIQFYLNLFHFRISEI